MKNPFSNKHKDDPPPAAKTATSIDCPQCGQHVAILENLPQNDNSVDITCPNCGLGQVIDTSIPVQP